MNKVKTEPHHSHSLKKYCYGITLWYRLVVRLSVHLYLELECSFLCIYSVPSKI